MGEWETGLGLVLAILFAAFRPRPADTQLARPTGFPPAGRFTDVPDRRDPAQTGWPPGVPSSTTTVRPDGSLRALFPLTP
jgi:hypothetical protein